MSKSKQILFMFGLLMSILGCLAIFAAANIAKRDIDKNNKYKYEVERILDEGYTSDEIVIMKSISPEFNYYELYIPEYSDDGRLCVIQNVNDKKFIIINSFLDTDPNVAK